MSQYTHYTWRSHDLITYTVLCISHENARTHFLIWSKCVKAPAFWIFANQDIILRQNIALSHFRPLKKINVDIFSPCGLITILIQTNVIKENRFKVMLWSANRLMQVYGGVRLEKWKSVDTTCFTELLSFAAAQDYFLQGCFNLTKKRGRGTLPCPHLLFVRDEGA